MPDAVLLVLALLPAVVCFVAAVVVLHPPRRGVSFAVRVVLSLAAAASGAALVWGSVLAYSFRDYVF